ncbi:MAG: 2-oxoacid:acceptor oxidoreductase subunit alpha [Vicinamibacteria bacterium]|jgi:2-oxoglutarate ferredoxin oxidoreductase subunit alpha|nr:2-oxoacid:acceptor oxidoreductase subunit alpha [Vicinamibacteria bacterium]
MKKSETLVDAVIRFAGDSGDGIQVTGNQFTNVSALFGNTLATFPDYPAEIRAPAGTPSGVSGFQVHFSTTDVLTPGDAVDALVVMNPAALKVNLGDLKANGIIIINADSFQEIDLKKAKLVSNPLKDHSLDKYRVFPVEITRLTRAALEDLKLDARAAERCKNFFALGMCYWLYHRPMEPTIEWLAKKFKDAPVLAEANQRTMKAGFAYCEATEIFQVSYEVPAAQLPAGTYRNISGNTALALGFVAAAQKAGLRLFQGSYPITPASEVLHELSWLKSYGVVTFQAEDEIAAMSATIGAAFAGALAITTTSGPGMALKSEAIGLATMVELPVVICNIQRGGPSTGLPTKTEQADLMQALYGRSSESPVAVLAAATSADCFEVAYEASRLAIEFMTPVIVLSDGYLANGAEPWRIPRFADLPAIPVSFRTDPNNFQPYARDPVTLARPWALPGTPGLEHRVGGLEKEDVTGRVNYEALNHERMVKLRAAKLQAMQRVLPPVVPLGDREGDVLIVAWGSTFGVIEVALRAQRAKGRKLGHIHLRHLNPLPPDLGDHFSRYKHILVPEMNLGQLRFVLQATYRIEAIGLNKVQGQPFKQAEIEAKIEELLS